MRKAKSFLALWLVIAMLVALLTVPVSGAEESLREEPALLSTGTIEVAEDFDLTFSQEDGTLTISGTGGMRELSNYYGWEYYPSQVKKVVIRDGILNITENAFAEHTNLTEVEIPDSVTVIEDGAFQYCTGLTKITIPAGVTELGSSVFSGCTELEQVEIAGSLTRVGDGAFESCVGLTEITLPCNQATIGKEVFTDCENLKKVTISSEGRTTVGVWMFDWCTNLTEVTFSGDIVVNRQLFGACGNLTKVNLLDGFTTIGVNMFSGLTNLTEIQISDSVTTIEMYAFYGCTGLTQLPVLGSVQSIGESAFQGCTGLTKVSIPDTIQSIGASAFRDCTGLTEAAISGSGVTIGDSVFSGCTNLTKATLPAGATTLGKEIFSNCTKLAEITIPAGITGVGTYAFYNCIALTKIPLPDSVTTIGDGAFAGCTGLTELKLPEGVTDLGDSAFAGCTGLTEIVIPQGVTEIKGTSVWGGTFKGCSNLKKITLPEGVTTIGSYAFANCTSLKEIRLPETLTAMKACAFLQCSALTEITIPDRVTTMEYGIFSGCSSLAKVDLPRGLTSIDGLFQNCTGLKEITIPDSVTTIGGGAFSGCTNLTEIIIPGSVKTIGSNAFSKCSSLTDIILMDGIETIGDSAFSGCTSIKTLIFPDSVTSIGQYMVGGAIEEIVLSRGMTTIPDYAFAGMGNEKNVLVTIPDSITSIGWFAFNYSNVTILCSEGSYAEEFAISRNIPYDTIIFNEGKTVTLNLTSDGEPISDGFSVKWYDGDSCIGVGRSLKVYQDQMELSYEIILDESLAFVYQQPERKTVTVSDSMELTEELSKIETLTLSGTVQNSDGAGVASAKVRLVQTAGEYTKTVETQTDAVGWFQAELSNLPTVAYIEAEGYYKRTITLIETRAEGDIRMEPEVLIALPPSKITLSFTRTDAAESGAAPHVSAVSNGNGLILSLYDATLQQEITDFTFEYPYIIPGNTVAGNHTITISVTDTNQKVTAQPVTVQIDENRMGRAEISLIENGRVKVNALGGLKKTVFLFDTDGRLVTKQNLTDSLFLSVPLKNGDYQVVFVEKSNYLAGVSGLSDLTGFGLEAGVDYAKANCSVQSGVITVLDDITVPDFDESKLCYTDKSKTSITTNYGSVCAGRLVSVRAEYKILEDYDSSGQTIRFELPEGVDIMDGSLTVGGKSHTYTEVENTVTVITSKPHEVIRFFCTPTQEGMFTIGASLEFEAGGVSYAQPLGGATFTATLGELQAPKKTPRKKITVSGNALSGSIVKVYSNDVCVGETRANAVGSWELTYTLQNTYGFSYHHVYAAIENSNYEGEVRTETRTVIYQGDSAVDVSKVTMYNTGDNGENVTVFDFEDPGKFGYYRMWPGKFVDFTFVIEFTGDASLANDVVLNVFSKTGEIRSYQATLDRDKNQWIVKTTFENFEDAPVNVGVEFYTEEDETYDYSITSTEEAEQMNHQFVDGLDAAYDDLVEMEITEETADSVTVALQLSDAPDTNWNVIVTPLDYEEYRGVSLPEQGFVTLEADDPAEPPVYLKTTLTEEEFEYIYVDPMLEIAMSYTTPTTELFETYQEGGTLRLAGAGEDYVDPFEKMDPAARALWDFVENLPVIGIPQAAAMADYARSYQYINERHEVAVQALLKQPSLIYASCPDTGSYRLTIPQRRHALESYDGIAAKLKSTKQELYGELDLYLQRIKNSFFFDMLTLGGGRVIGKLASVQLPVNGKYYNFPVRAGEKLRDRVNFTAKAVYDGSGALGQFAPGGLGEFFENFDCSGARYWNNIGTAYAEIQYRDIAELNHYILSNYKSCEQEEEPPNNSKEIPPSEEPDRGPDRDKNPIFDPSGYVYEGVPSNRVSGATATVYYYGNELDEFGEPTGELGEHRWNAEAYDQNNPLVTDRDGGYAWDVPKGRWLVKYSKDGYYDADSKDGPAADEDGYLPVPPPQLEVNTQLISKATPEVSGINVYHDEIRIQFSQYMKIASVNTDNVKVWVEGEPVTGTIVPVNAEDNYFKTEQFASLFAFVPDGEIPDGATVEVSNALNYHGVAMAQKHEETKTAGVSPKSISVSETVSVSYNAGALLEIEILPKEAGANKKLTVSSSSPSIVDVVNKTVTTDENGKANVMLSGNLPGDGEIRISLDGTDLEAMTRATVGNLTDTSNTCGKVTSNLPTESVAVKGTKIVLSTKTDGAEIYYTLDGTCPCELENPARIKYTEPLTLTEDMFVIAYAVKEGMEDSPTAGFTYRATETPVKIATPVVTPTGGRVPFGTVVALSTETKNATIYYTLDGSEPTEESAVYTKPFSVTASTIVKAVAVKIGMENSDVLQENYVVDGREDPGILYHDVTKTVTVTSDQAYADAVVFVAAYREGRMISLKLQETDLIQGDTLVAFPDFDSTGADAVKVMVWENLSSYKPLFDVYQFSL